MENIEGYEPRYWGQPGLQLPSKRSRPTGHLLDEILASRTHVRVLRTLVAHLHRNHTGRSIARTANISHSRVAEVLQHLTALGVVVEHRHTRYCIFELSKEHPLTEDLRSLFEEEGLVAVGWPRTRRRRELDPRRRT